MSATFERVRETHRASDKVLEHTLTKASLIKGFGSLSWKGIYDIDRVRNTHNQTHKHIRHGQRK